MMNTFRIRNFAISDLPAVLRIARMCFTEDYSAVQFMRLYEAYPEYFIVVENVWHARKNVIGFIVCALQTPFQARILLFAVDQAYRRKGVGSALLTMVLQRLDKNVKKIILEVKTTNLEAIQLYFKFGFKIVSLLPNYYKNNENAHVMEKNLL